MLSDRLGLIGCRLILSIKYAIHPNNDASTYGYASQRSKRLIIYHDHFSRPFKGAADQIACFGGCQPASCSMAEEFQVMIEELLAMAQGMGMCSHVGWWSL